MASVPSSDTTDHGDGPTGFLSLPRELRDEIYDMVWEEHHRKIDSADFIIRTATARRISHQLKSEYDQRSAANSFVGIVDRCEQLRYGEKFPRFATHSSRLGVIWGTRCACQGCDRIFNLGDRLGSLMGLVCRLPLINNVRVRLYVHVNVRLKSIVDGLMACPVLASWTVEYKSSQLQPGLGTVQFAVWSHERGLLVDNTDEEKAREEVKAAEKRLAQRNADKAERSRRKRLQAEGDEGKE